MAIFLDLATRMDAKSAEDAAKAITEKFVGAAQEINATAGGILSKMFDGIDGSKGRNEVKSLADEYAKLARAAGDAERAQVSSAGNVEVAILRLSEAHKKYGDGVSQTLAAQNRLTSAQALSKQAALDAAAATDVASAAHDRLGSSAAGAAGSAGGMNSTMLLAAGGVAAVGLAAVEAGRKLYDMGEQWADVSDKITFATGKVGADAKAMTDQVAAIADKTAAPIDSIAQVYTQLTRLKELQGSTLDDMTKHVADYDQMAAKAGAEPLNLGSFTRMAQEFHIPADQMRNDLNILVGAAQAGQVPLNELVQTMQNAGPAANIAGLSFGQMSNVLAALDESGVNVDTALKGIQLGLTNIAKDSPALQKLIKFTPDENALQRLKDVIAKIHELQQAQDGIDADKLGTAAFGRGWEAIVAQIEQGKFNVDDLNTSLTGAGDKIGDMRTATMRFGDEWEIVKNQIDTALKPLSEDVFKVLNEGLIGFEQKLEDFNNSGGIKKWWDGLFGPDSPIGALFRGDILKPMPDIQPHGGASGHGFGVTAGDTPTGAPGPNNPTGGAAVPTAPNINTAKPYYPLDLNPADKPPGAETYDTWVSSQKAVQSALNAQADSGERVAAAQLKQKDLLDSGKATQEQLNSVSDELATAERANRQATDDVTIAKNKYVEDTNKATKGKNGTTYDPFTAATKNSQGLIPELAGLATAFVTNLALGNPYGKILAAKRGEDPSNPMFVSDVSSSSGATPGGLPGLFSRFFSPTGQAPQAPSGGQSPSGSIPTLVPGQAPQPGRAAPPTGAEPSGAVPITQRPDGTWTSPDPAWAHLMNRESGGNPTIPNTTDSNAQRGDPSVGLFQITGDTWRRAGGAEFAPGAGQATPEQQAIVAARIFQRNPSGSDWGAGLPGREDAQQLLAGLGLPPGPATPSGPPPGAPSAPSSTPPSDPNTILARKPDGTEVRVPRGTLEHAHDGRYEGWHYVDPGTPPASPASPAGRPTPGGLPGILGDIFGPPKPGSAAPNFPLGIPGYATGGTVAASDTVPAMLTPKEFVVKKDAAEKNRPELEAMNAGRDPHKPTPDRVSPTAPGAPSSSRQPLGSVTPPPPGPRIGQGTGGGFGIGGGIIGMAETAAIMAAMGAAGMAEGGPVADPAQPQPGGGGGGKGGGGGGGGDPMTAVLNRTVGYFGQLGGIAAQGLMSSLIPGASQKGGIMDGGIIAKLAGGIAGAHPSAPNTAGNTAVPLAPPGGTGPGQGGDTHNHIGTQAGVSIGTMHVGSADDGKKVADDLAFQSYAGYGGR